MTAIILVLAFIILTAIVYAFITGFFSISDSGFYERTVNSLDSLAEKLREADAQKIAGEEDSDKQSDDDDHSTLHRHLTEVRQAVAQAIATERELEQQKEKNLKQVQTWDNRANMALEQRDEALSEQAFIRKRQYSVAAQELENELVESRKITGVLKERLTQLEVMVHKVDAQLAMLTRRHMTAHASVRINEHFAKLLAAWAESQNKLAEERLHGLIDQMPSGMMVVDKEGHILAVNPQIENLMGESGKSICEKFSFNSLFEHADVADLAQKLDDMANNGIYSTRLLAKERAACAVDITISSIDSGDFIVCIIDATTRKTL